VNSRGLKRNIVEMEVKHKPDVSIPGKLTIKRSSEKA
jgi:hypothetical protein